MEPELNASSRSASQASATENSPLLRDDASSTASTLRDTRNEENGEPEAPISEEASTAKIVLILGGCYIGVFLAALDSTIIATLAAPISSSFHSLSSLSWIASAYLIANAAFQPLSGKLTDIFSRRYGLVLSNVLFAGGNLVCGLAENEAVMIAGRVIMGMGGGGLFAISTFVASDLIPLRKRGIVQGIGNICYGVGSGLGGVFGGAINDTIGWRYAFLIQVPVALLSAIVIWFTVRIPVRETSESRLKRVDFLGSATLVSALVILLLGLNSGGTTLPWSHPLVVVTFPVSALILVLFVYVELHVAEPIIPVRLLLDRTVASACLTNWFAAMAVFTLIFYGPIYFQVKGLSTTQAGIRLIPQSIGAAVGSLGSGYVMKATGRYYWLSVAINLTSVLAISLICTFTLSTPEWPAFVYFFLAGIGYGGLLTITLLALIAAVDHSYQATITSASYAFRSTGSTLGITFASAVFQNILTAQLYGRFSDQKDASKLIPQIRESLDKMNDLPPGWKEGVLESYMGALNGVFGLALGMAMLAFLCSLIMREHKLYSSLARND